MTIETKKVKELTNLEKDQIKLFLISILEGAAKNPELVYTGPDLDTCVLIKEGDTIVAHTGITKRTINHAGRTYQVGGIGDVAVLSTARHQGYGSKVLQAAKDFLQKENYDLGLLFCDEDHAPFYIKNGWLKKEKGKIYFTQDGIEESEDLSYLLPIKLNQDSIDIWTNQNIHIGTGSW